MIKQGQKFTASSKFSKKNLQEFAGCFLHKWFPLYLFRWCVAHLLSQESLRFSKSVDENLCENGLSSNFYPWIDNRNFSHNNFTNIFYVIFLHRTLQLHTAFKMCVFGFVYQISQTTYQLISSIIIYIRLFGEALWLPKSWNCNSLIFVMFTTEWNNNCFV